MSTSMDIITIEKIAITKNYFIKISDLNKMNI